ncbi:Serine/threonine-protein phosphatase [Durusdinium trenchii]|uniref:Serine/threonine-protein phosphatase n=1 Tax=Durusdinium trenchii TaxID=1381693 RepID=A0ABP0SJ84_9DINO
MAKRKADQTEDQFETPQKLSRRAEPLAECLSLLDVQQAVPDFGGLLADYLWCDEDETAEVGSAKGTRPVQEMLMTGRSAQLQLITGMKEARLIDRPPMETRRYAIMCDHLTMSFPSAWKASKKLSFTTTPQADQKFVRALLSALAA